MDSKETLLKTNIDTSILHDAEYYKYIFKKTEKIVCAVFFILRSDASIRHDDVLISDLEKSASSLLDYSLRSLRNTTHTVTVDANEMKFALIGLESKLRMICSAQIISTDLLEVFVHEIDSVQRSLRKYTESSVVNPLLQAGITDRHIATPSRERRMVQTKTTVAEGDSRVISQVSILSRRDRVLNVIKDKGEATIKDVMENITDCSEKTIQRELISLIKDKVILREGERRWSKYKLI